LIESGELAPIQDISDSIEVPRELIGPATAAAERLPPAAPGTVALVLIAMVVVLTAVRLGAAFFIPLLLSLFLNYALSPTVNRLERWGLPRPLGAAIVIAIVVAVLAAAVYRVATDAVDILEQLPKGVQKLRLAITDGASRAPAPLEHVKEAATELEKLANATTATKGDGIAPSRPAAPAPSPPTAPAIDVRSILLVGTSSVAVFAGQVGTALLLTFFLLNAGDLFRRKLMQTLGPSLTRRKTALRILQSVDSMNQHYFAVVLFINILVGIATGLALWMIGLERPLVWGIAATILHTIPYLGSAVVAAGAAVIAYTQFSSITTTLLAAAMPIAISIVLGMGVQTWMMGRAARMNSPTVFIALLFWGMLWGAWGLLLAVPVMVVIKTICDHVPRLKAFSDLLGPLETHNGVE
jgi:predicted PurR-regulated permease PerM